MRGWPTKFVLLLGFAVVSTALAEESEEEFDSSIIQSVVLEFQKTLAEQGSQSKFQSHKKFASKLFADSEGEKSFKDKTGNCRLHLVENLVTNPDEALCAVDVRTRRVFEAAKLDDEVGMSSLLRSIALTVEADDTRNTEKNRIMAGLEYSTKLSEKVSPLPAKKELAILVAQLAFASEVCRLAFKPLTPEEMAELRASLYAQTTGDLELGHRFAQAEKGRRVTDLLEKIDRFALTRTAHELGRLNTKDFLAKMAKTSPAAEAPQIPGAKGSLHQKIETPHGVILVGGPEANEYQLDELANVAVVIDLGGNDIYHEGTTTEVRPVLVIIDYEGDDLYQGQQPGIQGGAILGISFLIDLAGNDKYQAVDVAQGSALGGIGVLIDKAGNDTYVGDRRVQGQATGGLGLLMDRGGDDKYRAALLAQGVGGPLGCGTLIDLEGADHYFAGGKYPGGYDDTPGFGSWSQGVGVGPRGVANGGVGLILDGGGDDIYEADYFSHGGGYWFAVGVARDFGGNDQRLGATRENFDGTDRTEPRFVRWGTGFGCHYAAGFVIDDKGNDTYQADFAVIAYAWDIAVAGICDLAGDDKYITAGSGVCEAHNAAVAFLYDKSGSDEYQGGIAGTTEETQYHPEGGSGNYTFLLDEAGEDTYGRDLKNGQVQTRGWAGAILIDR